MVPERSIWSEFLQFLCQRLHLSVLIVSTRLVLWQVGEVQLLWQFEKVQLLLQECVRVRVLQKVEKMMRQLL